MTVAALLLIGCSRTGTDQRSARAPSASAGIQNTNAPPPTTGAADLDLRVVSKRVPIPNGYIPAQLVPVPSDMLAGGVPQVLVTPATLEALRALQAAAKRDQIGITLISGYRTLEQQEATLRAAAEHDGPRVAERQVALPGFSEHHLGTAVDFGIGMPTSMDFARTPQAAWLTTRASEFGFALSYPPGSEAITGMEAEPWHYRYVGRDHAASMKAAGIALETYLERLPSGQATR